MLVENSRYYLYWIHRECHTDITRDGYIGVTNKPIKRFSDHKRDSINGNYPQHNAIRKYKDILYTIICIGDTNYILNLEYKLRSNERIGWNIGVGGRCPTIGCKMSEDSVMLNAVRFSKISRIDVLNLWVDYFEKGLSSYQLVGKYNISRPAISRYLRGDAKVFEDLEDTRLNIKKNQMISKNTRRNITEELYNKILKDRESGMVFTNIGKKYGISDRAVRSLCYGVYDYIRKFNSFRVIN